MKLLNALAALALVSMAGAAVASDKEAKEEKAPKEKKICRSEPITGSLTRVSRVCMTQAEWDRVRESTQSDLNRMNQNNSRFVPERVGGGAGG